MAPNLEPVSAIGFEIRVEMEIYYQNMPKSRFCEKCKLNLFNTQLATYRVDPGIVSKNLNYYLQG